MRHFRGVPTLIQNTQNKFSTTLPTQDPTNITLQTNNNKPVLGIGTQQIQLHHPTKRSHSQCRTCNQQLNRIFASRQRCQNSTNQSYKEDKYDTNHQIYHTLNTRHNTQQQHSVFAAG